MKSLSFIAVLFGLLTPCVIYTQNTAPPAPDLVFPSNNVHTLDTTPTLAWRIPTDAEGDSLHFKVEVATDASFTSQITSSPFESKTSTTGFSPTPPQKQGNALQFDGVDDYVDAGNVGLDATTDDFTMELWVSPLTTRPATTESNSGVSGTSDQRYAIAPEHGSNLYGSGHAGAGISIGTNGISVFEHSSSYLPSLLVYDITISGWNHIAVVYESKQPKLYLNGQFIQTGLTSTYIVHPSNNLGDIVNYGPFNGTIDEVRIWDVARTQAQIQSDMYTHLAGTETGLVAYWDFNETTGTTVNDKTTNNNVGTINGATRVTNDGGDAGSYTVQSALAIDDYYWRVSAWDSTEYGAASSYRKFTVQGDITPYNLTADSLSASSTIKLNWDVPVDATVSHYVVYRSLTDNFSPAPSDSIGKSTTTAYTDSGLDPGKTYYYKVAAVYNSGNKSGYSNQARATAVTLVSGQISSNTTWNISGSPYVVTSTVSLYYGSSTPDTLTIESGVTVKFNSGTELQVGRVDRSNYPGVLIAEGTSTSPITFTSSSGVTNGWKGIYFANGSNYNGVKSSLKHCLVENAGESNYRSANCGIYFYNTSGHTVDTVTVRDNTGYGIYMNGSSATFTGLVDSVNTSDGVYLIDSSPTIKNSRLKNNGGYGLHMNVGSRPYLQSNTYAGNTNEGILVDGGNMSNSTTWYSDGVPYIVTSTVSLYYGSSTPDTLTIKPGVTVKFNSGTELQVGRVGRSNYPGVLTAEGTSGSPITFTSSSGVTNGWKGIYFADGSDYGGNKSSLKYCVVENAGESNYRGASSGIYFYNTPGHTLDNVTIRNNGGYAIRTNSINYIPVLTNLSLSGNTTPGFATDGGTTTKNITLGHYGEPYWTILTDVTIAGSDTLTVSPGVTVRFSPGARLQIGSGSTNPGRLYAVGKLDSMITFTSTKDTIVGGWEGIYFDNASDESGFTSTMKYCIIEKGGATSVDANIKTYYTNQPTIDSCIVRNSAKYGIWIRGDKVPTINNCDIYSHKNWYLYNNTSLGVTATSNYWGTQSGIDLEDRLEGIVSTTPIRTTSVFSNTNVLTPPYSLNGQAASDTTIKLTWTASTSKVVAKYYVYRNDGYGGVDYSVKIDSVVHPTGGGTVTWTSSSLPKGYIYKFGTRAAKADGTVEENFDITAEAPSGGYIVSGGITENTTWTAGGSPYRFVDGNVTISAGKILTIEPGVTVKFRENYFLQADGGIRAVGSATDTIRFTSYNQNPAKGDWYALKFTDSAIEDTNKLDYCIVEYSGSNSTDNAAIYGKDSKLSVDHSIVRHSNKNGIYMNGGDLAVSNSWVYDNIQSGVADGNGNQLIDNVKSYDNAGNGFWHINGTLTISNSEAYNNSDDGIYFSGSQLTVQDSTVIKNNTQHGIEVYGGLTLNNSYIQNNNAGNTNYYGVRFDKSNQQIQIDSTDITGNANGLYVGSASSGSLVQRSTISNNSQYGANIRDRDVTLDGNTITGNGTGVYATDAAVLTRNLITTNGKGVLTNSTPRINFNNLYGNTGYYLETTGSNDLDAKVNWWGTINESTIETVIKDNTDDSQLGTANYKPVLTDTVRLADTTAPVLAGVANGYNSTSKTQILSSGRWYDYPAPYFDWTPATDTYPVVGYSMVFSDDTAASAIPNDLPDVYDTTYTVSENLTVGKIYYLKVRAVDNNYNASQTITMFVYKYDVGAPVAFDLLSPGDGETAGTRPAFRWNAAQDSANGAGIEKYRVYIDDTKVDSIGGESTVFVVKAPLSEGSHTWFVVAVDSAGHSRSSSQTWTVNVSRFVPEAPNLTFPYHNSVPSDTLPTLAWLIPTDIDNDSLHFKVEVATDTNFTIPISASPFESKTSTTGFSPTPPLRRENTLQFDGVDDVVDTGSDSTIDDVGPMTITAWIKPNTLGENSRGIIAYKVDSNHNNGWRFNISNYSATNQLTFYRDYTTTRLSRESVANSITLDSWQHVAVTWDGSSTASKVKLYVNGTEVSYQTTINGSGTKTSDAAQNLRIGNNPNGDRTFDGLIDDVRFWNVARTKEHIRQDMYTKLTGNEEGLVAYFDFNGTSASTVYDKTANGNNGIINGATRLLNAGADAVTYTFQSEPVEGNYYWRASAWDGRGYGNTSDTWMFSVQDVYPNIVLSTDSLNFGLIPTNSTRSLPVEIANYSRVRNLVISSISSSNTAFTISPNTLTVKPRDADTVSVSFTPTTLGPYVATLTIECNDPNQPTRTVHFSGKGAPAVVASTPAQNAANVSQITDISATFSADIDVSTLVDTNFIVFGEVSGKHGGVISYESGTRTVTFSPESSLIFGERVQVVLTEDVMAEAETIPLATGYSWEFTVAPLFGSGEYSLDTTSYMTEASPYAIAVGDFDCSSTQIFAQSSSVTPARSAVGKHLKRVPMKLKQLKLSSITSITGNLPVSISSVQAAAGIRYPDFVVANSGANSIRVFMNQEGLISQTPTNYNVGTTPEGAAVADIDGDGNVDIITANNVSNDISVLLNEGDGTFGTASEYGVGAGPRAIAAGDLDNDGDLDIVTGNMADNSISILFNDGSGMFGNPRNIRVGDLPSGIVLEDMDNDGDMDIAVSNKNSDDITVLLNGEGLVKGAGMALQFDGSDDYVDIFSPSSLPSGSNSFTMEAWIEPNTMGDASIVGWGNSYNNQANVLRLKGSTQIKHYFWNNDLDVTVGDLSGAWHHVVITYDGANRIIYLDGEEKGSDSPVGVNVDSTNINIGRSRPQGSEYFNGIIDEIRLWNYARSQVEIQQSMYRPLIGNESGLFGYWRFNEGSGTTTEDGSGNGNTGTLVNGPQWVSSTAPLLSTTITVGKFSVAGSYTTGTAPNGLAAHDFDGDGDVDLATANGTSNDMSILFNDGNGVFSGLTNFSAGTEPSALYGNDLDADGDIDLAVANSGDDNVVVFLNDGSGTFTAEDTVTVGSSPRAVIGLDISGEFGIIDLAVPNLASGNVSILKNQIPGGPFVKVLFERPGEQSGDVALNYSMFDASGRNIGILCQYSTDGGGTWLTATATGDTSELPPENYRGSITWNSRTDLPDREERNVRFKFTPSTLTDTGRADSTDIFILDNYHFHSADISLKDTLTEYSDNVSIIYSLADTTFDELSICAFYRLNSGSWSPATLVGNTTNLDSSKYTGTLIWDSRTDLAGVDDETVRLKLVPTDGWKDGEADSTGVFHLDNNEPPAVQLTDPVGEQTGDISVAYDLSDAEGDLLDISLYYSTDGGVNWTKATVTGDTTGITVYSDSMIWNSYEDLPGQDVETVSLQLIPMDNDTGLVDTTAPFHLDNNELPTLTITDLTGEQTEDVSISYVLVDAENDPLSIYCEYSDGSAQIWSHATVTGDTSGISSTKYSNNIVWHTRTDLMSADGDMLFRITPRDSDVGIGDTTRILLDNNLVPSIQITDYVDTVSVETQIDFTLSDDENDTLAISGFFSTDDGQTWSQASLEGKTTGLTQQNYTNGITWLLLRDVGYQRLKSVLFSLSPSDRDSGEPDTTGYITILNYPADFNGDLLINTDDLAIFAVAWNAEPQDTLYDIGPASGEAPELTPLPDGVLDFEDLMVFIQMWNWSFARNGFISPITMLAKGGSGPLSVSLSQRPPENPWKSDGTFLVDVFLSGGNLLMADGVFSFDGGNLEFLEVSNGDFFKRAFESTPFFHQVGSDSNSVLFASVGLGKREKERKDFGNTPVATIRFKKSPTQGQNLVLNYNLRNLDGELVESAQVILEVKDLVPVRFALHPNYPNPFNPITRIRFEVPEPARVKITIYDILGREVMSLVDRNLKPGYYEVAWDGKDRQGSHVSSGMYIYTFRAKTYRATRKMILIR